MVIKPLKKSVVKPLFQLRIVMIFLGPDLFLAIKRVDRIFERTKRTSSLISILLIRLSTELA